MKIAMTVTVDYPVRKLLAEQCAAQSCSLSGLVNEYLVQALKADPVPVVTTTAAAK